MDACMGGWMDGWMDRLTDGWVDKWMYKRMNGWTDGWMVTIAPLVPRRSAARSIMRFFSPSEWLMWGLVPLGSSEELIQAVSQCLTVLPKGNENSEVWNITPEWNTQWSAARMQLSVPIILSGLRCTRHCSHFTNGRVREKLADGFWSPFGGHITGRRPPFCKSVLHMREAFDPVLRVFCCFWWFSHISVCRLRPEWIRYRRRAQMPDGCKSEIAAAPISHLNTNSRATSLHLRRRFNRHV